MNNIPNTRHSEPSSSPVALDTIINKPDGPKSTILTSDNLIQGGTAECMNMGSNGQNTNLNNQQVPDVPMKPEKEETKPMDPVRQASTIPLPSAKDEKISENDGKNVDLPKIHQERNQEKEHVQEDVKESAQQVLNPTGQPEKLDPPTENKQDGKIMDESLPPKMDSAQPANYNMESGANDQEKPMVASPRKSAGSSPHKNGSNEEDNRSANKNAASNSKRANLPKRETRPRKARTNRRDDQISKCHI